MNSMRNNLLRKEEILSTKDKILSSNKLETVLNLIIDGDEEIIRHINKLIDVELEQEYSKGYTQANSDRNQSESVWSKYEDFY